MTIRAILEHLREAYEQETLALRHLSDHLRYRSATTDITHLHGHPVNRSVTIANSHLARAAEHLHQLQREIRCAHAELEALNESRDR